MQCLHIVLFIFIFFRVLRMKLQSLLIDFVFIAHFRRWAFFPCDFWVNALVLVNRSVIFVFLWTKFVASSYTCTITSIPNIQLYLYVSFSRQDLTQPWLVPNSLHSWEKKKPLISDSPAFTLWVLELTACATIPGLCVAQIGTRGTVYVKKGLWQVSSVPSLIFSVIKCDSLSLGDSSIFIDF